MNLSHAYGAPVSAEQGERVLLAALDAGVTLFDTATLYGFGANETLVGRVLKQHRSRFTLASKCGMQGVDVNGDGKLVRVIDGRPATLRQTCEDSLRRLQTDVIDLYYLHRWDKKVPHITGSRSVAWMPTPAARAWPSRSSAQVTAPGESRSSAASVASSPVSS